MLAQDLMRFGIIYSMFIIGFSQAYFIIFQSYEVDEEDEEDGGNPLRNPTESFIQVNIFYHMKHTISCSFKVFYTLDVYHVTWRIWRSLGYIWWNKAQCDWWVKSILLLNFKSCYYSKNSLVHLHVTACHSTIESSHCHDGRHICQGKSVINWNCYKI